MTSRVSKPKTQRGKRFLLSRESKIEENAKRIMLIRGGKTSEIVTQALRDIHAIKKPNATMFHRKNILRPFEDQTSLEFFSQRNDASLLVFGSHSKKRPHNLVLGCFYDHHVLDMIELGIERFLPISSFKADKVTAGTKPCVMFTGEEFENKHEYRRLKTMLLDMWRGEKIENVRLQGLEHIIQVTACEGKVYFRSYRSVLKKSGLKTPRVEVEEIGPSFDFEVRRTHLATESLYKESLRKPKAAKPRTKKNIGHDTFGTKTGRIHMQKQDLGNLQTRKMKGLKKRKSTDQNKDSKDSGGRKKTKTAE